LLVDLNFNGKYVVIVGGGSESYRKTQSFVEAGSKILVASKTFSRGIKELHTLGKLELLQAEVKDTEAFVKNLKPKPDLLVAVTNNHTLNAQLIKHAKTSGCMVYSVDNPVASDFILPALAKVGEVRIAISTTGKSPAMARLLRQRIEKLVTQEDLLQIKLQTYARAVLKKRISDQKVRKQILYKILKNPEIKKRLKEEKFNEAQEMAMKVLEKMVKDASKQAPVAAANNGQGAST
jgi:precorrin-2 dehydrogenase/sirohydrochlorin ferrochelatase